MGILDGKLRHFPEENQQKIFARYGNRLLDFKRKEMIMMVVEVEKQKMSSVELTFGDITYY